jgi:hypothetical protein
MQTDYEPHPIALEYPPLSADDLGALRRDIKAKGLLEKIVLFRENGPSSPLMILDGWHRYQACVVEGIEPDYEEYTGDDPHGFAESKNVHRRQLTLAQRKALAKKRVQEHPERTSRAIGRETGITHQTVEDIRRKLEAEQAGHLEDGGEPTDGSAVAPSATPGTMSWPPAPTRSTSAGRKAPGRPALTAAEKDARKAAKEADKKAARAAAPPPVSVKSRGEWITACATQFNSHARHALEDLVMVVMYHEEAIQEKVTAVQRRELLTKFAEALGFRLPDDF